MTSTPPARNPAPSRWRITERGLRLATGIVLFAFATTHFFNAGMGLFGIEAANAVKRVIGGFWGSRIGAVLLYGSLIIHFCLGIKNVAFRRTWRMPVLEAVQIVLGFLIPLWLIRHIVGTRGVETALDISINYRNVYLNLWPDLAPEQALLLLIVWVHGCIGLAMVLRLKPWFMRWRDILLGIAVGLPLFALAGFLAGMREAIARFPEGATFSPGQAETFNRLHSLGWSLLYLAFGILAAILLFRAVRYRASARLQVRYAGGPSIRVTPGATLLEISRANGVAHASVCGGRARCSTCRVRVLDGSALQPEPNQAERRLLSRIGAPDTVRLACQLRPEGEILVQRLVDPGAAGRRDNQAQDPFRWGVERSVTLMFADIRGFTTLSEHSFAFDIVFILNRFLTEMSNAIESNGGKVDKYLGDGLMAIFGADGADDAGSRNALAAARAMGEALVGLNQEFMPLLNAEIRIGVGLHTGPAILGRIGGGQKTATLTALGDTVNIAARLEELTKAFNAVCVLSAATAKAAGLAFPHLETHDVQIRGRNEPLKVHAVVHYRELADPPIA